MRKLMLVSASVIALVLGGEPLTQAAGMSGSAETAAPPVSGSSQATRYASKLSKKDIQQAQWQLRAAGLYDGPINGNLDAKTRLAIAKYQKQNGLSKTATLDQATMRSLLEDSGVAGSTSARRAPALMTNPHPELLGSSRPRGSTAPY